MTNTVSIVLDIISAYGWLSLGTMIGFVFGSLLSNSKEQS